MALLEYYETFETIGFVRQKGQTIYSWLERFL